ncbi:MAG: hypothetical protein EOO75_15080 [Myxococcales bacterium]|nr:MAG: hypothetical protein EOO75_15080 [Myxococcales bacterium]
MPGGGAEGCSVNSDCTTKPNGFCGQEFNVNQCQCVYGCLQDSDCASDELCECGTPVGRCLKASCKSGADCTEGGCAQHEIGMPGCGTQAYACQTKADECVSNQDCLDSKQGGLCHVENPGDPTTCEPFSCAVGRPLVVEQAWRLATLQASSAWG